MRLAIIFKKSLKRYYPFATIEFFQENIKLDRELEAYICVTCSTEDGRVTMTPRANNKEAQLEFEEFYNTALFYACEKKF